MFSVREKRQIAMSVHSILRSTKHPELPEGEIQFSLHVDGAESWSFADIKNNGSVPVPSVSFHNELADPLPDPYEKTRRAYCNPETLQDLLALVVGCETEKLKVADILAVFDKHGFGDRIER